MKVILLHRIPNLGSIGKIVNVKNGYARNYLLPFKKALRANEANQVLFEAKRSSLEAQDLELKSQFLELSKVLKEKTFTLIRSAGDTGHLYGSVTARDIVDLLNEEGFKINRRQILLDSPIKSIGIHNVAISLHADIDVKIQLNVARSTEESLRTIELIAGEKEELVAEKQKENDLEKQMESET
ncbi:50S ribosomal protein L9 [Candidatus Liberibacter sp.]|uniref:50S ribosomal protein L9 n=1 Tax=Candidatus Liberibacter sp. TaxID=34022 RepID=UPI0015F6AEC0|nr:50S ribosomal protein L9 [Candidatus Liberibacter sp.]MBA5724331.1 50S ribosomal protein L9 [Candidatus Liberibacter sp.]